MKATMLLVLGFALMYHWVVDYSKSWYVLPIGMLTVFLIVHFGFLNRLFSSPKKIEIDDNTIHIYFPLSERSIPLSEIVSCVPSKPWHIRAKDRTYVLYYVDPSVMSRVHDILKKRLSEEKENA